MFTKHKEKSRDIKIKNKFIGINNNKNHDKWKKHQLFKEDVKPISALVEYKSFNFPGSVSDNILLHISMPITSPRAFFYLLMLQIVAGEIAAKSSKDSFNSDEELQQQFAKHPIKHTAAQSIEAEITSVPTKLIFTSTLSGVHKDINSKDNRPLHTPKISKLIDKSVFKMPYDPIIISDGLYKWLNTGTEKQKQNKSQILKNQKNWIRDFFENRDGLADFFPAELIARCFRDCPSYPKFKILFMTYEEFEKSGASQRAAAYTAVKLNKYNQIVIKFNENFLMEVFKQKFINEIHHKIIADSLIALNPSKEFSFPSPFYDKQGSLSELQFAKFKDAIDKGETRIYNIQTLLVKSEKELSPELLAFKKELIKHLDEFVPGILQFKLPADNYKRTLDEYQREIPALVIKHQYLHPYLKNTLYICAGFKPRPEDLINDKMIAILYSYNEANIALGNPPYQKATEKIIYAERLSNIDMLFKMGKLKFEVFFPELCYMMKIFISESQKKLGLISEDEAIDYCQPKFK